MEADLKQPRRAIWGHNRSPRLGPLTTSGSRPHPVQPPTQPLHLGCRICNITGHFLPCFKGTGDQRFPEKPAPFGVACFPFPPLGLRALQLACPCCGTQSPNSTASKRHLWVTRPKVQRPIGVESCCETLRMSLRVPKCPPFQFYGFLTLFSTQAGQTKGTLIPWAPGRINLLHMGPHPSLLSTLSLKGGLFENKLAQANLTTPFWEPGRSWWGGAGRGWGAD